MCSHDNTRMCLKYLGLGQERTREKARDTRTGDTLWRTRAQDIVRIELPVRGKLQGNTGLKLIYASLSNPNGYVSFRPCSSRNLCSSCDQKDKILGWSCSFDFQLHCSPKRSPLKLSKK